MSLNCCKVKFSFRFKNVENIIWIDKVGRNDTKHIWNCNILQMMLKNDSNRAFCIFCIAVTTTYCCNVCMDYIFRYFSISKHVQCIHTHIHIHKYTLPNKLLSIQYLFIFLSDAIVHLNISVCYSIFKRFG